MKYIYLALAVVGAVIPYLFFLGFFQASGFNMPLFVTSAFVNGAAGGFTADLFISSFVFWLYMFQNQRAGTGPGPLLFIVLNLTIGLSCALPAYLYSAYPLRTRRSPGPQASATP